MKLVATIACLIAGGVTGWFFSAHMHTRYQKPHFVTVRDTIKIIKIVEHPIWINNPNDIYFACNKMYIPFPELWVAVAKLEAGHRLESWQATNNYNLFGFSNCVFNSHYDCLLFLKKWVEEDPPKLRESGVEYMKRRKWNPYSDYWPKLNSLL